MAEPALRKLDQGLPRMDMRTQALAARQRERLREVSMPPSLADIRRTKEAALEEIRAEAATLLAEARAEAVAIVAAAVVEARQEAARIIHDAVHIADKAWQPQASEPVERRLVADIIRATAERHGVPARRLIGRGMARNIVMARHEAIAEAYQARPDLSLPVLGRLFGNRDHTTILHALRKMGVYQGRGR